jgi:hypothetical protein
LASDRPFHRQFVKLATRLLLGGRRAHYHAWLPWLGIEGRSRSNPGTVTDRGRPILALDTADLLRRRAGGRILIVGSGPSVTPELLHFVPARTALLLNGAISLLGEAVAEPLAVAIEDERFVWRHRAMIRDRIGRDVPLLLSLGVIRALTEIDPSFLPGRPVILIDDVRKPFGAPRRTDDQLSVMPGLTVRGNAGFSADPHVGVFQGGSVVVSALQFALASGASEIGFIGVDIGNAGQARFYEREGEVAYSGVAGAETRILDHIALARDIASARGVRLVNHSPLSAMRSIGLEPVPLPASAE